MPRQSKGPRLYLRAGRTRKDGQVVRSVWVIRDGAVEVSTGCAPDRLRGPGGAEEALKTYLADKFVPPAPESTDRRRDPAQVYVAEVLALYALERAPNLATNGPTAANMLTQLGRWWGDKTLADVRRSTCKEYIRDRTAMPDARYTRDPENAPRVAESTAARELDVLGGAIGWWHGEDPLATRPKLWRPETPQSPRDALTRDQAAALLKASLGYRFIKGKDGARDRWMRLSRSGINNRRHLRRFILIGLYTGTRHAVIRNLLWEESPAHPWIDLNAGRVYRRGREEKDHRNKKRPVVTIPPRLLAHMRRWRAEDAARDIAARTVAEAAAPSMFPTSP